jgi:hypothetical protein
MTERPKYGPYHRTGQPGGPGCNVGVLPIKAKQPDGSLLSAVLFDAGTSASELELLRTAAERAGIKWGHDDMGWWAMVPQDSP